MFDDIVKPSIRSGTPVPVLMTVTVKFDLKR
jgi:hypothetical protein